MTAVIHFRPLTDVYLTRAVIDCVVHYFRVIFRVVIVVVCNY